MVQENRRGNVSKVRLVDKWSTESASEEDREGD